MSTLVTTTAVTEVVEVSGMPEVVETVNDSEIFEVAPAGPDTVTESEVTAQIVLVPTAGVIAERWVEATIIESATQGPPGPPGAAGGTYPAKHLTYTDGEVSEVLLYSDAAATQLAERRVITRAGGNVTGITYFDGAGVTLHTRTFTYTDGVLISIADH